MLARREWGRAELAVRLRARGGDSAAIERVLDELAALGYLSDARCAEAVVASRRGNYSRGAIAYALRERRIEPEAAQAALGTLSVQDEAADATALWQRRYGAAPGDRREHARQVRFLLARGYSIGIALAVLRAAGAALTDDSPPS